MRKHPHKVHAAFTFFRRRAPGRMWYTCRMEKKVYLDARDYLRDMWRLARQVLDSGWRPDVLLALWRGGAEVGVAVHERLAALGCDMRMVCVYWKPEKNMTPYKPDFHVRTLDRWIVFPHEIEGLTPAEIAEKDEVLAALMKIKPRFVS